MVVKINDKTQAEDDNILEIGENSIDNWVNTHDDKAVELLLPKKLPSNLQQRFDRQLFIWSTAASRHIRIFMDWEKIHNRGNFMGDLLKYAITYPDLYENLVIELYRSFDRWSKSDNPAELVAREITSEVPPFIAYDEAINDPRKASLNLLWKLIGSPRQHLTGIASMASVKEKDVEHYLEGAEYILKAMKGEELGDWHELSEPGQKVIVNVSSALYFMKLAQDTWTELRNNKTSTRGNKQELYRAMQQKLGIEG